jgi:glycosyltransferase involved in cell wall biosynthesis
MSDPQRILMLVPHKPNLDPRVKCVIEDCSEMIRTDVIACVTHEEYMNSIEREYNQNLYVEFIDIDQYSLYWSSFLVKIAQRLYNWKAAEFIARAEKSATVSVDNNEDTSLNKNNIKIIYKNIVNSVNYKIGEVNYCLSHLFWVTPIMIALYNRAKTVSVIPKVILCHDIYALIPGVIMKKVWNCLLVYDSHEFWPEAHLLFPKWACDLMTVIEKYFISYADQVITVSLPLAKHLKNLYKLPNVLNVPNAEPFNENIQPSSERQASFPIKFLLQGNVAPKRGIREFLDLWKLLDDQPVTLYLRAPLNDYLEFLKAEFKELLEQEKLIILPPVTEDELISAATFADVGIIPYIGPNLNHVYCCPNKLSQYMQAGLGILSNKLEFVSEVISEYQCGMVYDVNQPESFIQTIQMIIDNQDKLQEMKENSYKAARHNFNWEVQSSDYKQAIKRLLQQGDQ